MMNMVDSALPSLHLLITPKVTENGNIAILQFSITVKHLRHRTGDVLCTYTTQHRDEAHSSSPLQRFLQGIPATLTDGDGALPFTLSPSSSAKDDGSKEQEVYVAREARGDIVFSSEIRALDEEEVARDISALRRDQGGVVGAGTYFLPHFRVEGMCNLAVTWDLTCCPEGTRTVCSLGEGPGVVEASGFSETLLDCVFMVGPVESSSLEHLTGQDTGGIGNAGFCTTYWLGNLPEKLDAVKDYASNVFPHMSEHFNDERASYRAFLRRIPKGLRSGKFRSSALIDYDADVEEDHDWDLVRVLNRAMVSAWAQLDPEDDGTDNWWFTNGLALLYTVYLPFRFGQRGPDYFRATVNAFLSANYTNPLISEPLERLDLLDPQNNWHVASAKMTRAFVYMLKMDTYTRQASVARDAKVLRPIDEVVRDLCTRRRAGEKVQKDQWLKSIAFWIGLDDAERYFQEMIVDGKANELDDMSSSFGSTYGLQPVDQELLEFGFGRDSLTTGVVATVVSSSRAYEAGLRKGDRLTWHSRPETCELHPEEMFELSFLRKGKPMEIEYLPRAREKVRCWQVLDRPKPSCEAG